MRSFNLALVLVFAIDAGFLYGGQQPIAAPSSSINVVVASAETELPTQHGSSTTDGDITIPEWAEERVRRIIARGEQKAEAKAIAALSGEWEIRYSNKVVRRYTIEPNGNVVWDDHRLGHIKRTDGKLLLTQKRDQKVERLTLGVDGRLFVEHWSHTSRFPDGAFLFGIGIRQK